jgi:hypothetical protein
MSFQKTENERLGSSLIARSLREQAKSSINPPSTPLSLGLDSVGVILPVAWIPESVLLSDSKSLCLVHPPTVETGGLLGDLMLPHPKAHGCPRPASHHGERSTAGYLR